MRRICGAVSDASTPWTRRTAEVAVTALERDFRFFASERRTIAFDLTNLSERTWPAGDDGASVCASYRWRGPDGATTDGPRTPFPVDVVPGETITLPLRVEAPERPGTPDLVVDVVHETVRWFGADLTLRVHVSATPQLPDRRRPVIAAPAGGRHWGRTGTGTSQIPKIIHHVWLGGGRPPAAHERYMETWRQNNPRWKMRLWTDANAPHPPGIERARNVAERADLVRYEVLRRHGGVYVDTDVECLRPIEPLLAGTRVFAGYEVPGRLCNAVMGGVRGHRAFTRLVALAERTVGIGVYPSATATTFLTRVLEPEPQATLFGPELFYPYLWDEPRPVDAIFPDSYAVHHWATSWLSDAGAGA